MALKSTVIRFSQSVPSTCGRGNNGAEINRYRIFCNPSPLPVGEGIMVLKSTVIGFSVIRPLFPWERVRERAKPQDTPYRFFLLAKHLVSSLGRFGCETQQRIKCWFMSQPTSIFQTTSYIEKVV